MKSIFSLLLLLSCSFFVTAQTGLYIKYETIIESTGEDDGKLNIQKAQYV